MRRLRSTPSTLTLARKALLLAFFLALFATLRPSTHAVITLHYWNASTALIERDTFVPVTVSTSPSDQQQAIDYQVVGHEATAGRDFVAASGTLTFAPGETQKTIRIQILDDSEIEGSEFDDFDYQRGGETFSLTISNPVPQTDLATSFITFRIFDDDTGYEISYVAPAFENDPFLEAKVRRQGDFNVESSVELYTVAGTARPGVDYLDQTLTLTFPAGINERVVRIPLLNDSVEDGERTVSLGLRNPTAGIPLSKLSNQVFSIFDNELPYQVLTDLHNPDNAFNPVLLEGGTNRLYLLRRGDYQGQHTATVTLREWGLPRDSALAGEDFRPATFQITFAPGQTLAEIPVEIVNDNLPEGRESFLVEHPFSPANPGKLTPAVAIVDNEFNPGPVTRLCLGLDPRSGKDFAPYDPLTPVQDGFLVRVNSEQYVQPFLLIRLKLDGSLDDSFQPITLDHYWATPLRIIETADRKYLVQLGNTLRRYLNNGTLDTTFNSYTALDIRQFSASNGKVYIVHPNQILRLNSDGTLDTTFTSPQLTDGYISGHAPGPAGTVYVHGLFTVPGTPALTNYARLTSTGAFDLSFAPTGWQGSIFSTNGILYLLEATGYLRRVTPAGDLDPSFQPLPFFAFTDKFHLDSQGRFYLQRQVSGGSTSLERFTSDGKPDPTFFRVQLDHPLLPATALSLDGSALLVIGGSIAVLNGVEIRCPTATTYNGYNLARVDLNAPPRVYNPPTIFLLERDTGGPDVVPFMRSGRNDTTSAAARYRVRNGSATNGVHFNLPLEGEVHFKPGQSRIDLPLVVIDNFAAEPDRNFYLDLLDATGAPTSTGQVRIINDDYGIEILGEHNQRLRVKAFSGEYHSSFEWFVSSDLVNWESAYVSYLNTEVEIDLSGKHRFIRGVPTTTPGTHYWESPVFTRP